MSDLTKRSYATTTQSKDKKDLRSIRKHFHHIKRKKVRLRKRIRVNFIGDKYTSRVLQILRSKLHGKDVSIIKQCHKTNTKRIFIEIPKSFSFIRNGKDVFNILYSILSNYSSQKIFGIHFDHRKCEEIDMAASLCLDIVVTEIRKEWRNKKRKMVLSGLTPESHDASQMLNSIGLTKHLEINNSDEEENDCIVFPWVRGIKRIGDDLSKTQDSEKVSKDLVEYYNNCASSPEFVGKLRFRQFP